MFFGPTISSLHEQYFIHFLCLSHGNTHRAEELAKSAEYLGAFKYECIHNENMIDGMTIKWDEQTIRDTVKQYVQENNIKAIFTFDQYGISNHINHRSIYHALSRLEVIDEPQKEKKEGEQEGEGQKKTIKIYYLETTNIIRKYIGMAELLLVPFKEFSFVRFNYFHGFNSMAMHKSQFVWFRHLFVLFSRYTYINTYQMKKICFD
jgi:N-acetylglucosaminylphosphatidylinositol deacetylase